MTLSGSPSLWGTTGDPKGLPCLSSPPSPLPFGDLPWKDRDTSIIHCFFRLLAWVLSKGCCRLKSFLAPHTILPINDQPSIHRRPAANRKPKITIDGLPCGWNLVYSALIVN